MLCASQNQKIEQPLVAPMLMHTGSEQYREQVDWNRMRNRKLNKGFLFHWFQGTYTDQALLDPHTKQLLD